MKTFFVLYNMFTKPYFCNRILLIKLSAVIYDLIENVITNHTQQHFNNLK